LSDSRGALRARAGAPIVAGVRFWQAVAFTEPEQLGPLARTAEEVGFHGLTIDDHLVTPAEVGSTYPYPDTMARLTASLPDAGASLWDPGIPHLDPWVLIGALAQVTTTLRFMTYVYVLPLREPFSVAKALSSAAVLSGNRVVLGTGVGWMAEEFALTGQRFEGRGARADEMLEVIALLNRGGMVEHHGRSYDFGPLQMAPAPCEPVPVYIGGHSPRALRRAARHDGWVGINYETADIAPILARLAACRREAGTDGQPFEAVVAFNAAPSVGELRRMEDAGVTAVVNPPWLFHGIPSSSLAFKQATLEDYAERYIQRMG